MSKILTPQKYEQQTLSTSKMCQNLPDMVLDNDYESSPQKPTHLAVVLCTQVLQLPMLLVSWGQTTVLEQ